MEARVAASAGPGPGAAPAACGSRARSSPSRRSPSSTPTCACRWSCRSRATTRSRPPITWRPEWPNLLDVDVRCSATASGRRGDKLRGLSAGGLTPTGTSCSTTAPTSSGWCSGRLLAGVAPGRTDAAALRREVELVKELGFNGVRSTRRWRTRASSAGATGSAWWCGARCPAPYEYSPTMVGRLTASGSRSSARDRSHPCIVAWVPLNESWGVPDLAQTRPSATSSAPSTTSPGHRPDPAGDRQRRLGPHRQRHLGVHDYGPTGHELRQRYGTPRRSTGPCATAGPVAAGCCSRRHRPGSAGDRHRVRRTVASPEREGLVRLLDRRRRRGPGGQVRRARRRAGGQPHDRGFLLHPAHRHRAGANGLLTAEREPKIAPERVREVLTQPARAVPAEEIDAGRAATLRTWASEARPPGRPSVSS